MRRADQLVDKVLILALFLTAPIVLVSCGAKDKPALEPISITAAADSAQQALDGKLAVIRDSANKPSIFFDTLYRYYALGRMIEVQKRIDADSLTRSAVLAVDNIRDAALRRRGIEMLNAFSRRDSLRLVRRDSLRNALGLVTKRLLDSTSLPPAARTQAVTAVIATDRFEPEYRRELDSLIHSTVAVELEILNFLNESGNRIKVEEVLKFADANDLARYQMLTSRLAELAAAQQMLVDRVTYGVSPQASDSSTVSQDSAGENSEPTAHPPVPPPVQSWPDAVRIQ